MTQAPSSLQDLRRRRDVKAQAEPAWRCWGLCAHVCTRETLREAYRLAKDNDGAPGRDGVTFAAIEGAGVETCLAQRRGALVQGTYRPTRSRRKALPQGHGTGVRVLAIPAMRARVGQGALQRIWAPIVAADFQAGSYGYRPKRSAQDAVARVAAAIVHSKTRVLAMDLQAYVDPIRPHRLLAHVAPRVDDPDVMHV